MSDPVSIAVVGAIALVCSAWLEHRAKQRDDEKNEKLDHITIQTDGNTTRLEARLEHTEELIRQMVAERAAEGSPVSEATSTTRLPAPQRDSRESSEDDQPP